MEIEVTQEQLNKLRRAADITEMQMLMGRLINYLEKMDAASIWDELFLHGDESVSVEIGDYGAFDGSEHVEAFFREYDAYLKDPSDKRGWMDQRNVSTPYVVMGADGDTAYGSWSCFAAQAKQALPYPCDERTLTAIWNASKYCCTFKRTAEGWKFATLREVIYIRTPFQHGWVKQPDCMRSEPLGLLLPDRFSRSYIYHPDAQYSPAGRYNWGPFPPEEGTF
jgi:hypothetical protein